MGLDFDGRFSAASSEYDRDFMDYDDLDNDQPHASSSHSIYSPVANSIEEVLRRTILSDDNKENSATHSSTPKSLAPMTIIESTQMFPASGKSLMQSQKLQTSLQHDPLINEETESEAGCKSSFCKIIILRVYDFYQKTCVRKMKKKTIHSIQVFIFKFDVSVSGDDDDCMSNCGCVHNDEGTPADVSENAAAPFNRLGFRSVGDIIGYAQVVRSERLEALAELRSAVEKFNDMRQRNQNLRSKLTTAN